METIRLALQKSGRLTDKSIDLLKNCGVDFHWSKNRLIAKSTNFPIEVLLVRDDDIPNLLDSKVADLGIVGQNVLLEKGSENLRENTLLQLGFGQCRLSFAIPQNQDWIEKEFLTGRKIATSYPVLVERYLKSQDISAQIVEISGSVELAPALKIADVVCDLVSTGGTLQANGLKETQTILESQSVLVAEPTALTTNKEATIFKLVQRMKSVLKAKNQRYIMMNAPRESLAEIRKLLPGMANPSIMPLDGDDSQIAIHTVCTESIFWQTMESLKALGANSVLVAPIEKIV